MNLVIPEALITLIRENPKVELLWVIGSGRDGYYYYLLSNNEMAFNIAPVTIYSRNLVDFVRRQPASAILLRRYTSTRGPNTTPQKEG